MRRLLSLFLIAVTISGAGLSVLLPAAYAASDELIPGCEKAAASPTCASHNSTSNNPLTGPAGILTRATQIIATITGIAAVIMIIIGGFRYVLSNGDASAAASARKTIIYAAVGLLVTIASGTLVSFALSKI